ncbi:hypothetical protein [Bifidobacterium crudilactis]|jgi:hypothetical protein|uniref:hypothetical protein n=1 Tax=Bifidobacterium crudilactis TaxID=327277 RepID=UPI0023577E8A|nr:hypothetical protein [Bifidobacterium crudilactis]MCI1868479.1 hypothetical protein [Bifidobacterium crudilactis]
MTTALGVDVDTDGNGVDPLTHRQIIKRHWNNTGIIGGLTVSGRPDLYYAVSAGVAVCSMGDADGYTEAYWPGGKTENTVSAGDGTYSRIDSVYLLASTGTPDNQVHCKVLQGTPSASPVAPTLTAGALLLQQMLVPAGASKTSSASVNGSKNYAIPYGGSLGRLGALGTNTNTTAQEWKPQWYNQAGVEVPALSTDRLVQVDFMARASGPSSGSSYRVKLIVDGSDQSDGQDELPVFDTYVRNRISYRTVLTAGRTHQVIIAIMPNTNKGQFTWRGLRTVEVTDIGVAQ